MAQKFAQIQLRIWVDKDFLALSSDAQRLYFLLLSQEDRGPSGLLSLRARRWAGLSADGTVEKVMAALAELDDASFLVVDTETAEVLVRTFIRNHEIFKHIRMLRTALDQAERAESERIRSALGQELARIPRLVVPDPTPNNARSIEEAHAEQQHLDEVVSLLNDAPPDPAHGMQPWDEPMGWGHPPITSTSTVTALGSCSSREIKSLESNARAKSRLTVIPGKDAS